MSEQLIGARSVCIKLNCLFVVYYSYIWHRKALNHACYQHTTPTFVRTLGGCEIYHCELELDGQALMDNVVCSWEVRAKSAPSTTQLPRKRSRIQATSQEWPKCISPMPWLYLMLLKFYECKSDDIVRTSLCPHFASKTAFSEVPLITFSSSGQLIKWYCLHRKG